MKIKDAMTRAVRIVSPDTSLKEAARLMGEADVGALPVASGDRLTGMVTDRDITVRAVALGKGPSASVGEVMSFDVIYCHEEEDLAEVCDHMADRQLRRLPVVDSDHRVIGIVSLADIALAATDEAAGALEGIARPGGAHSQTLAGST